VVILLKEVWEDPLREACKAEAVILLKEVCKAEAVILLKGACKEVCKAEAAILLKVVCKEGCKEACREGWDAVAAAILLKAAWADLRAAAILLKGGCKEAAAILLREVCKAAAVILLKEGWADLRAAINRRPRPIRPTPRLTREGGRRISTG